MKILASIILLAIMAFIVPKKKEKPYFAGIYVTKVAAAEYLVAYLYSDSTVRAYINDVGAQVHFIPYVFGGRKAISVAPAFNHVMILDDQHYVWRNTPSGTPAGPGCTRYDTDTAGNAFNYSYQLYAYFDCYLTTTQNNDSLIYWATTDGLRWIDGTGTRTCKPFLIWQPPSGRTIKKVAMGLTVSVLLDNGDVYERGTGGSSFSKVTLPAGSYCTDVYCSYKDFRTYILHNYAGGDPTLGVLAWAGSRSGFFGDNQSRSSPFILSWPFPNHLKSLGGDDNTAIMIDSAGRMWGNGDNPQGEVGNGQEIVNRYDYHNFCCYTPYAWSTDEGQNLVAPAVEIGIGQTWKYIADEKGFAFHHFAITTNDSLYRWGRSKSFDLWPYASNNEATYPNNWDILSPTQYTLLATPTGNYITFVLPRVHCVAGQPTNSTVSTSTSSISLGGLDTANFSGPVGYSISSYQWSLKTKPGGAPNPTYTSATSQTTTINGLQNGQYQFYKKMTDNNTGIWADSVTVNVNIVSGCGGCTVLKQVRNFKRVP